MAAGLVPLAIGTDGGGSIRRPAAYTGLVGLKPSIGRVARGRGLPQILHDFEVVGPLARTTQDLALLFRILASADLHDHRSRRFSSTPDPIPSLRILYVERFGDAPLDPEIASAVGTAANWLAAMGCEVTRGALPIDINAANAFWQVVGRVGLATLMAEDPAISESASPKYIAMAEEGAAVYAVTYQKGLAAVSDLRDALSQVFAEIDLIMSPACAAMPWPKAEAFPPSIDGERVDPRGHAVYTGWVNVSGHPAISLPTVPSDGGLPIGFQLIGDIGTDWNLIEFAGRFEAEHPWVERRPKEFSKF